MNYHKKSMICKNVINYYLVIYCRKIDFYVTLRELEHRGRLTFPLVLSVQKQQTLLIELKQIWDVGCDVLVFSK